MPTRRRVFAVPATLQQHGVVASAPQRASSVATALVDAPAASSASSAVATARRAATVMVVRDRPGGGAEVFMLRRASTMTFAPSVSVFPGGGVDPRDSDDRLPWAGPSAAHWAGELSTDVATARELVVAAAREVFEECGVLLAGPTPDEIVGDLADPQYVRARAQLVAHEMSFAEFLIAAGLVLRTDLLRAHAHWVTPAFEPRRYDTMFFAALLPTGHVADGATSEAVRSGWAKPADVLARADAGEVALLPPTRVQLERLATAPDAASFVTNAPAILTVLPWLEREGDRVHLVAEVPE